MANRQIQNYLAFANQQMAAEAFLSRFDDPTPNRPAAGDIEARLEEGNFHAGKFMPQQAAQFVSEYEVLAQCRNDPLESAGSGFSGTLFRDRTTGELTLSFRSTEFIDDAVRDSKATNDLELRLLGWAFGQIAQMEAWYAQLRQDPALLGGRGFNVTGYSLGGHLATAFNILRREEAAIAEVGSPVLHTYTFNGAGVGGLQSGKTLTGALNIFRQFRDEPDIMQIAAWQALTVAERSRIVNEATDRANAVSAERARVAGLSGVTFALNATEAPAGVQAEVAYQIAALMAARDTVPVASFPFFNGVNNIPSTPVFAEAVGQQRFANITEIVGSDGGNLGSSFVANSGIHYGTRQEIYIEDQPLTRGTYSLAISHGSLVSNPSVNDFADTHSLVLLVDSLSLLAAFERLDPDFTVEQGKQVYTAISSSSAESVFGLQGKAEGDVLERGLDALRELILGPGTEPTADYAETLDGNTWHAGELRAPFHENLRELNDAIEDLLRDPARAPRIDVLVGENHARLRELAHAEGDEGQSYRYALAKLNPFALLDADYARHNQNGELDMFNPQTGRGAMTEEYLRDRVQFLYWNTRANAADSGMVVDVAASKDILFTDNESGIKVEVRREILGTPSTAPLAKYAFGSPALRAIAGSAQDDHLYGGAMGETISGGFGNDYLEGGGGLDRIDGGAGDDSLVDLDGGRGDRLEGGAGFDTYTAEFGDVIVDSPQANAGAVYVHLDGERVPLTGGTRTGNAGYYTSADGRFKYWTSSQGAIQVFRAGASSANTALTIQAPTAPVPGFVETATQSVRGRPDLGIALVEYKDPTPKGPGNGSSSSTVGVKKLVDLAKSYRPFGDPLALDLAGNGFQTVGDLGAGTILFDHDAVGVRNGTGWLSGADGLVVLDRDGDGLITTGRELFGDNTILPDGTKGADGFAALAPMDSNGDLRIDAADLPLAAWQISADADGDGVVAQGETRGAAFGDLLLWRDENLNGISEPLELVSLADSGIQSVGLAKIVSNQSLPGGNTLLYRAAFTRDDGTTGTAGALNLTRENFYREYTSAPTYAPGAENLPILSGTGRVRDLQEAAGESEALRQLVQAAAAATDRATQATLSDQILRQWAADSSMRSGTVESAHKANAPVLVYSMPGIPATSVGGAYTAAAGGSPVNPAALPDGWFEAQQSQEYRDTVNMIGVLERFTGQTFADIGNSGSSIAHTLTAPPAVPGGTVQTINVYGTTVSIGSTNLQFARDAYALLQESVTGSVAVQTRLVPYVNAVMAGAPARDFSAVEALLADKRLIDPAGAVADVVELGRFVGADLIGLGWTNLPLMIDQWLHDARSDASLAATLADLRVTYRDTWQETGGATSDVLLGTPWVPPFASNALLTSNGGFGDDLIFSDNDFEVLFGGQGNDILYGGAAGEVIAPGLGRDIILFGRGSGVDQVDSSRDPDVLSAPSQLPATDRDAVYLLPGVGPGEVRVRHAAAPYYAYFGTFSGSGLFDGVALTIAGTGDVLYDAGFSHGGTTNNNYRSIEEVHFSDGTLWDLNTLRLKQMEGTEFDDRAGAEGVLRAFEDMDGFLDGKGGNDRLQGLSRNDTLLGGPGNDELLGAYGNDLLLGGDGNDVLEGYFGSDTLNGGAGNDQLYGGAGVDYYVLARNNGVDRLINGNAFTFSGIDPALDVVRADPDVAPDAVRLQRRSNGLHIYVDGANTELWDAGAGGATDPNPDYLGEPGPHPGIGRIEFADGTVWNGPEIKARSLLGASGNNDELHGFESTGDTLSGLGGNDVIRGLGGGDHLFGGQGNDAVEGGNGDDELAGGDGDDILRADAGSDNLAGGDGNDELHGDNGYDPFGDDVLDGGAGNDFIYGYGGNDTLSGGAGDDTLVGSSGVDTAYFGPGGGRDAAYAVEVLRFEAGVSPSDIDAWREGGDILFRIAATGDQYRAVGGYAELGRAEFADGTVWTAGVLAALESRATEGNDTLYGTAGDDQIRALGGNDTVYAYGGNDLIDGGPGTDAMHGGDGDDVYLIDSFFDQVVELLNEGIDEVRVVSGYDLASRPWVENLRIMAAAGAVGSGNDLANNLIGGAGADTLVGRGADDLLQGNAGNDALQGGAGDDRFVYSPGDGQDTIYDASADANVLRLQSIAPSQVILNGDPDQGNIFLSFQGGASDAITLNSSDGGVAVSSIEFDDGTVWTRQDILDRVSPPPPPPPPPGEGTPGDDILYGVGQYDFLDGRDGNDQIHAGPGHDALIGGPGNDILAGGPGSDVYFIMPGDGNDLIVDEATMSRFPEVFDWQAFEAMHETGELNYVYFHPGILSANIRLGVMEDDLLLYEAGGGTGLQLRITGFDRNDALGAHSIKLFVFEDWEENTEHFGYVDLLARGFDLTGSDGPEALRGTNLHDRFDSAGGNDLLEGGAGGDRYYFSSDYENDRIVDFDGGQSGDDVITMGPQIAPADIQVSRDGNDIVFRRNATDSISIFWDPGSGAAIERVEFADGTVWDPATVEALAGGQGGNTPPGVGVPLPDASAGEDLAFSYVVPIAAFVDPDSANALRYAASLDDGSPLPGWLAFDAMTRTFSGTPANADVGSFGVRVTATDEPGESASDTFQLVVANTNDAPVVASGVAGQSFEAGAQFMFALAPGSFADEDAGDSLVLSAGLFGGGLLPAWLSFDAASATFAGDPRAANVGVSHLSVTATDTAGATARLDFGLIVRAAAGSSVTGSAGSDAIYGGTGNETLVARGGSDYVYGDLGDDLLRGGGGSDVLQGGGGDDVVRGGAGQNLLDGGAGDDVIYGGRESAFIAGGTGNDVLRVGQGNDVIAFNAGDGVDTLYGGRDGGNTLSFGGGIRYEDLSLSRSGRDLVVSAGEHDRMVLKNWYAGNHSVLSLQLILDATDDYDADSADPLYNQKVQTFDFQGMVNRFDQALAASPGLTSWAVTNALLQFHLSGADDAALGGDLAYWYGRNNGFTGISLAAAQQVIGAPGFGSEAQSLRAFSGLQEGLVKLA